MIIPSQIFEAYLKCPTKCWLQFLGEESKENNYSEWVRKKKDTYRTDGITRLTDDPKIQFIIAPSVNSKTGNWNLVIGLQAKSQELESCIHVVERTPPEDRGRPAKFTPVRFIFNNKLTKVDKLMIAFDALTLAGTVRCEVSHGKIIHGDDYSTLKVKTSKLIGEVKKATGKIASLITSNLSPDLIFSRHCVECEYQYRCREKAIEKDDLSLLGNMTGKERKKLNSKGIFTVKQLSYTFRPRRRPKRLRERREKYHHSLKALAIRENKIHIVGSPELKIEGTPVFLDVEGMPDHDFYYLIGVRVRDGNSIVQHSLWADRPEDEKRIWKELLAIISLIESPVLIHYGSYESDFLKRMRERYGEPSENTTSAIDIKNFVNVLSVMYAQIYFPTFSNGLKDVASFLGFKWADTDCSGILSIIWRHKWDDNKDLIAKEKLIRYNVQDCEALELITVTIQRIGDRTKDVADNNIDIVQADSDKFFQKGKWRTFTSQFPSLEYINSAARWDYQRTRVYARTEKAKPKLQKRRQRQKISHPEMTIQWECTRVCPICNKIFYRKGTDRTKTFQDVIFGRNSIKLRLVRYVFKTYNCRKCGTTFGMPVRFQHGRTKYGWNLIAYFFYHVVELCIPQRTVVQGFNRLFCFELHRSTLHNLKIRLAEYYAITKQKILESILRGSLVHIDETRANIKGESAFVWVLTNFNNVIYILSESREGEIAHKLLADFKGVLVSDFYTAYDSIDCPQQKCLIHLMRDLNDEVLNFPFDEQLKQIVVDFGDLLKPIIETVDRYGLKKHFLKKYMVCVEDFFQKLKQTDYQSETAIKCKDRFERNRDKLFTFLRYDGTPWNNNNAEHAIKAFARLRDVIEGSSTAKGTEEYLTLLSISQTCKYRGLDFLDFLRSGEKDIDVFAIGRQKRQGRSSVGQHL